MELPPGSGALGLKANIGHAVMSESLKCYMYWILRCKAGNLGQMMPIPPLRCKNKSFKEVLLEFNHVFSHMKHNFWIHIHS